MNQPTASVRSHCLSPSRARAAIDAPLGPATRSGCGTALWRGCGTPPGDSSTHHRRRGHSFHGLAWRYTSLVLHPARSRRLRGRSTLGPEGGCVGGYNTDAGSSSGSASHSARLIQQSENKDAHHSPCWGGGSFLCLTGYFNAGQTKIRA
jgi:hypothetical protein